MPHWRSLIEKDYLGAWDLVGKDGKPRDFTLKISKVESRKLQTKQQPKGKRKAVIRFDGADKAMVANSTNCETIEGMYGADTDAWTGKMVTLYQTTCDVGPKRNVPCIRVRPTIPRGKSEPIASQPVDPAARAKQDDAFDREPGEEG